MADWSELPRDVIGLIASFLPLAEMHCFSAVCQNWRSVTNEKWHHPVPQLPWLVLDDDESIGKRRIFNMSENKHYHFDIPELRGASIAGSSFGWLFVVGPKLDAYLVNPFSGDKLSLPSLPIYLDWLRPKKFFDPPEHGVPLNECIELAQHVLVRKAVLSCDPARCTNFVVFISLAGNYSLAFYKSGDSSWTIFDCKKVVEDIVCFKGQYYALLEDNVLATIHIDPQPKIRRRVCLPYDDTWLVSYLVDYNGTSLLLVARLAEYEDRHLITTEFRVFKVGLESCNTCELEDIDGHSLFLGKNDNTVVRASDVNGCMANSIYFCDATCGYPSVKYGYGDMGIYNLEDKSIGHFYPPETYHPPQSRPIWLVPNTQARPWPWPRRTKLLGNSWAWGIIVVLYVIYCLLVRMTWNARIRMLIFIPMVILILLASLLVILLLIFGDVSHASESDSELESESEFGDSD